MVVAECSAHRAFDSQIDDIFDGMPTSFGHSTNYLPFSVEVFFYLSVPLSHSLALFSQSRTLDDYAAAAKRLKANVVFHNLYLSMVYGNARTHIHSHTIAFIAIVFPRICYAIAVDAEFLM